jgi:hypothetical protein
MNTKLQSYKATKLQSYKATKLQSYKANSLLFPSREGIKGSDNKRKEVLAT